MIEGASLQEAIQGNWGCSAVEAMVRAHPEMVAEVSQERLTRPYRRVKERNTMLRCGDKVTLIDGINVEHNGFGPGHVGTISNVMGSGVCAIDTGYQSLYPHYDVNLAEPVDGCTPLHAALYLHRIQEARLVLEVNPAVARVRDGAGRLPFEAAIIGKADEEMIMKLLEGLEVRRAVLCCCCFV